MRRHGSFLTLVLSFYICTVCVGADIPRTRYIKTHVGEDLSINCNVSTDSNVTVFWSKNDPSSSFTQSGTILNLVNIKLVDAGCYVCYSLDTSFPEHNGTTGNKTMDVVSVTVQNAEQRQNSISRTNELMENEKKANDNVSDDDDGERTQMIVVLTLSAVGIVGVTIFILYLIKYRLPRRLVYDLTTP